MTVEIVTFGCRLNAFESEVIAREAERAGLERTIIINSCGAHRGDRLRGADAKSDVCRYG